MKNLIVFVAILLSGCASVNQRLTILEEQEVYLQGRCIQLQHQLDSLKIELRDAKLGPAFKF